jgi:nucleotide-binding universal stress UspA family protein
MAGDFEEFQMKVLIPLDVTSGDGAAVNVAADRPWPAGTSFCLLNIRVALYPPRVVPRVFEDSKTKILQLLDHAAEPLKKAGWNVRTEVLEGSPRRTINAFAEEWGADLVMVGSHERSHLARLCLGSTAQSVMRHAPCSVEIVRARQANGGAEADRGWKILVATDGSEFSAAALRSVRGRPWPAGSQLKVISVPEFILAKDPSYLETHRVKEFGDLGAASIEDAKNCIAAAREILSGSPLTVAAELPEYEDRPYQVILHEADAWHADLIVVGSHGRSGFDRVVMGSVSEAVALHAKCSVEIVRERRTDPMNASERLAACH